MFMVALGSALIVWCSSTPY